MSTEKSRQERDSYYMSIAHAVKQQADCRHRVGAVIVIADRVVCTGYNGTPEGMTDCAAGGCHRCEKAGTASSGKQYDVCLCVHAEENALTTAARFGISINGASIYTTHQPCFQCLKALLLAGVTKVFFEEEWSTLSFEMQDLMEDYEKLMYAVPSGMRQISRPKESTTILEPVSTVVPESPVTDSPVVRAQSKSKPVRTPHNGKAAPRPRGA